MKCTICRSMDVSPGTTTVTLERGATTIVVKDVPADVCEACGEAYLDEAVTRAVFALGEDAVKRGAEVEILRYAA